MQKVYPELVQVAQDGLLAVNYIEFIPILIESIKEQQNQLDAKDSILQDFSNSIYTLRNQIADLSKQVIQINNCCTKNSGSSGTKLKSHDEENLETNATINTVESNIKLYQNAPNPFKDLTTIKLEIPQTVVNARVCIYDLSGHQLKCLYVTGRGTTSVQIKGNELTAGLYHYTLIADGNLIDTKTMVLTE